MSLTLIGRQSRFPSLLVCALLFSCTATELSVPRSHPGNPLAPTAPIAFATPLPRAGKVGESASPPAGDAAAPAAHHHHGSDAMTPADSKAPADSKPPAVTYTCVMHPQIIRDQPGNCPICGMKLVPKKDAK